MDWIKLDKMIRLYKSSNNTREDKNIFQRYVLGLVPEFNLVDWHFFLSLVNLNVGEMKKENKFWNGIYEHIKHVDAADEGLTNVTSIKVSLVQIFCESHLK